MPDEMESAPTGLSDTTGSPPFVRERRYCVIKISDANADLTPEEIRTFDQLANKVAYGRVKRGKPLLECVVVESDWPEYGPTWAAIERRMSEANVKVLLHLPVGAASTVG